MEIDHPNKNILIAKESPEWCKDLAQRLEQNFSGLHIETTQAFSGVKRLVVTEKFDPQIAILGTRLGENKPNEAEAKKAAELIIQKSPSAHIYLHGTMPVAWARENNLEFWDANYVMAPNFIYLLANLLQG